MKRRDVLQILSAAALAPVVSQFPSRMLAAAPSGKNGRLGLNLAGASYWSNEQVFSNLAENASRWRVQLGQMPFTWDTPLPPMTDDGYPKEIPAQAYLESFLIFTPYRKNLPVQLSLYYDGKGKIGYTNGAELERRFPGRDDVRNMRKNEAFVARIVETDPDDPIRNIRLYERGAMPTSAFRQPFLDRARDMSAIRFMDWMSTNGSVVKQWNDRPKYGRFGNSDVGVPLEYMIDLCNTVKAEPWFNMPHQADDDYVRQFATQVRKDLSPDLNVNVEYSNEVWNTFFGQYDYAASQGKALGLSNDEFQGAMMFYAKRATEIIAIWEDVFGADKKRVIGVYGAQSANEWTSEVILSYDGVKEHADVLAIAPYFGNSLGDPERANDVATWSLDRVFDALVQEVEGLNRETIGKQVAIAAKYGVKLYAYEGGQHLVGHGGTENNDALTKLFIAANRDPRMGDLYLRHLKNWWAAGGDLYTLFTSMSEPGKWGSWGLLEYEGGSTPKWDAAQKALHMEI